MSGQNPGDSGWFRYGDPSDVVAAATTITERTAEQPQNWPAEAVRAGFVEDEDEYYDALHDATVRATREAVQERETATEQQYSIPAMDDVVAKASDRPGVVTATIDLDYLADTRAGLRTLDHVRPDRY